MWGKRESGINSIIVSFLKYQYWCDISSLIILSLLSLVESSTTASTPDLLLVVLLLLQHLSSLAVVLLNSKLCIKYCIYRMYSSKAVLGLELLDVVEGVVDQGKTSRSATSYKIKSDQKQIPKATWKPKRMTVLSSSTLYFLQRWALISSLDTEARLGWTTSMV